MIKFTTTIQQAEQQGHQTGWTFIIVPTELAVQLQPGKQSFKVRGLLDEYAIKAVSLLPVGGGDFMMPLNAGMRKGIGKRKGAKLTLQLELDDQVPPVTCPELMSCLDDEPEALAFFNTLTRSHREYFIKWIDSAKTGQTRSKRIAQTVTGLSRKFDYGTTIRYFRDRKDELGY